MSTFGFTVPLAWPDYPYKPDTSPTQWLGLNGLVETEAEALRFTFRILPTGIELMQIERRLDEVNGGVGRTVDLDIAIGNLTANMRARYTAKLWPEGRPATGNAADAAAQQEEIDRLFYADRNSRDNKALNRMHEILERSQVCAEWKTLAVDPPAGWEDIAERPTDPMHMQAVITAYRRAKNAEERGQGK